jgi:hypothetical protein
MPIDVKVDSPVLTDGAGTELAVASLPLTENYSIQIDQFDMMGGNVKPLSVTVLGEEVFELNGKSYNVFKVEVTPVEDDNTGTIMWITKEDKKIVKTESKLPAMMGGGTVISELTE